MSSSLRGVQIVLILLFATAYYGTWYLIMHNGAIDVLGQIMAEKPPRLLGTAAPIKQVYTGVGSVDRQLTILTLFFWEIVDGSLPAASLQAVQFAGQMGVAWGLFLIEGAREGNRWRLVSFTVIWGALVQKFTFACTMPIYMMIHLSTSTTIQPSKTNVFMTSSAIAPIPIALTIGYLLPSFLASLPAPSVLTYDGKQNFIAFWQAFPVWVALIQQFLGLSFPISGFRNKASTGYHQDSITALRCAYTFLLTVAGLTHIPCLSMALASSYFPRAFFTSEATSTYSFSNVFVPSTVSASTKMASVGRANQLLLQYDEVVGLSAVLLWVTFLWIQAHKRTGKPYLLTELIPKIAGLTLATGPMGCAIFMMWSRDELVWREESLADKKVD